MSAITEGRFDVYQAVTDTIIAALEAGTEKAQRPWHVLTCAGLPTNALTKKQYRGVNVLALWASAAVAGYPEPLWGTYRQWHLLGAQVRRRERGSVIVFFKKNPYEVDDPRTGEKRQFTRLIARASKVFNVNQVEGYTHSAAPLLDRVERIDQVDAFVRQTGADIRNGFSQAYYDLSADFIAMPDASAFVGTETSSPTESYYGVLLHELVHWTGAVHRLDRELSGRFGEEGYAIEELVAELGAAFLCAQLRISAEARPDHAAYIASWLKVLKSDRRAVFTAAAEAAEAADYLTCW